MLFSHIIFLLLLQTKLKLRCSRKEVEFEGLRHGSHTILMHIFYTENWIIKWNLKKEMMHIIFTIPLIYFDVCVLPSLTSKFFSLHSIFFAFFNIYYLFTVVFSSLYIMCNMSKVEWKEWKVHWIFIAKKKSRKSLEGRNFQTLSLRLQYT